MIHKKLLFSKRFLFERKVFICVFSSASNVLFRDVSKSFFEKRATWSKFKKSITTPKYFKYYPKSAQSMVIDSSMKFLLEGRKTT